MSEFEFEKMPINEQIEIRVKNESRSTILTGKILGLDKLGFIVFKTNYDEEKRFLPSQVMMRTKLNTRC